MPAIELSYIPKPFKESLEFFDNGFFLRLAIFTATAETGHGRQYFVYVRTCCFDTAVTESACYKCPCFFLFELFLGYILKNNHDDNAIQAGRYSS